MFGKGKSFREKLKVEPKLGILEALKSLGLDQELLKSHMVRANILFDAGEYLGIPEEEIRDARIDKTQVEALRSLIGKDGSYRTLDGVNMSGLRYYIAVAKDYKGDVMFSIKRSGRRNEGALRDTDIIQTHTYNKDGIEMEYSSAEYFSDNLSILEAQLHQQISEEEMIWLHKLLKKQEIEMQDYLEWNAM